MNSLVIYRSQKILNIFFSYKQDNFVHVPNVSEYLERLGICTLKNACADFEIFKKDEANRNDVKIAPGDAKAAKTQELSRVGISRSTGTRV